MSTYARAHTHTHAHTLMGSCFYRLLTICQVIMPKDAEKHTFSVFKALVSANHSFPSSVADPRVTEA